MFSSRHIALFSVLTLSAGAAIAAFSIFSEKKSYLCDENIKKKPYQKRNTKRKPSLYKLKNNPSSSQCSADDEDIISKLPDDVLASIISRMPVKCGVKTSILSKRWRNLYRHVSNIKLDCRDLLGDRYDEFDKPPENVIFFEDEKFHHTNKIIDSAIRFLKLRSGSKIQSFELSCCFYVLTPVQFKELFCNLASLGVEKLALKFCCFLLTNDIDISVNHLSEITSLKHLKLSLCCFVPSSKTQYSSLQSMKLSSVRIKDGTMESILSTCLGLQFLRIENCVCPSKLCFKGPNLQLKSLYIYNCNVVKDIEFNASHLDLFEFTNGKMVNFIFEHVPQLQKIYLYTFKENNVPYACRGLAKDLPHLKSLTFVTIGDYFQGTKGFNTYRDLRRLDLSLYSGPQIDLFLLTSFLHTCPLLQEFHLNTNFVEYSGSEVKKQEAVIHSELKQVEISGFVGTENEIEFASYILKCAIGLEKMLISKCLKKYAGFDRWSSRSETQWSEETKRTIHRRLRGQAVSTTAQVIIQHHTPARLEDNDVFA